MKRFLRLVVLVLALCGVFAQGAYAVSPALEIIRSETRLIKCCVNGERVGFTAEEFEALTGAETEYITVTSLPQLSDGVLKLTGTDLRVGQQVSASGLRYMKFVPSRGFEGECSFTFTVAAEGWESKELECVIRYSETANFAPVAVNATIRTYKSLMVTAPLGAYDPDGDGLEYVIEQYPLNGSVVIDGGVAAYTPVSGFCGADSFTYHTVDSYGNKSDTARADIRVEENKSGIYFADMMDKDSHLAAVLAAENEVMTYTLIGNSYYFEPTQQVSRIDFAVMLVCAAGLEVPDKPYPTDIFTDTADQSTGKRLYLERAVTAGLIKAESATFRPNEPITVADAVAMVENALEDSAVTIGSAYYEDVSRTLTKEDAAVILSTLIYTR